MLVFSDMCIIITPVTSIIPHSKSVTGSRLRITVSVNCFIGRVA
jgi:hypothetical protein